jgi:methylenetetrahydrofolate dehydrogenase (NADP+)/methenyltetrahydrofolate cyclohydrolase
MQILDGKKAKEHYLEQLRTRVLFLSSIPKLVVIQVGDREDSNSYIRSKKLFAEKLGAEVVHEKLSDKVKQEEIIKLIKKYNKDKTVNGIIVQLPLPENLNADEIINEIDIAKDVDGLTDNAVFTPATARGIKELLEFYNIKLKNKKVTILGRSKIVGKPTAKMCENEGAKVTVCHSKTEDVPSKTKKADIVIVAIGKPYMLDNKYFSKGQIVVDVGITKVGDKLLGDVDFEKVKDIVSMITPVPGGVGQMTVLALFENLVDSCYNSVL